MRILLGGGEEKPKLEDYGDVLEPSEAVEPILSKPVRTALLEWLTEIWAKDELAAVNLQPRRKALFDGVPGVGKTTLAHHLAARLGLRMLAVRPDRIIDRWVGWDQRNLGELFDLVCAEEEPLVLFFDEFDAIAAKRRAAVTSADDKHNQVVNILLQRMEHYQGYLIAATNHGDEIDQAVWRRFEIHIELKTPGQDERERILARYIAPFVLPKPALKAMAEAFETATPALMRQFCESVKRQIVIGPKCEWNMQREAVIDRIVTAVQPHPDAGKPRLWSHGSKDIALQLLPWPLSTTAHVIDEVPFGAETSTVVPFSAPHAKVVPIKEARP